jgi:signal transduction histidine kinase
MVALMNGEISFHSEAGSGATFTVSLPVAEIDRNANPGDTA